MGNSPALPEITHFQNILDKPIRGIDPDKLVPLNFRNLCLCCSTALNSSRKHNCRGCGEVICEKCSNFYDVLPDNKPLQKKVRVCRNCIYDKRFVSCNLCSSVLEAKDYSIHENEICGFRSVKCSLCKMGMKAREEKEHQRTECPLRLVQCPEGCPIPVAYSQQEEHLQNSCSKRGPCPNGCSIILVPSKVTVHTSNCTHRPVSCNLCKVKVPNIHLDQHSKYECPERIIHCDLFCGVKDIKAKDIESHKATKCPNRIVTCVDSCGELIALNTMNKHLTEACSSRQTCQYGCMQLIAPSLVQMHRNVCNCRPVTCSDCRSIVSNDKLNEHKANECQERFVSCLKCNQPRIKAKDLIHHTSSVCEHRVVNCPENCGERLPQSSVHNHLVNSCNKRIACRFGCNERVASTIFSEHAKQCICRPTTCSQCDKEVLFNRLRFHLENDCSERIVECNLGCAARDIKARELEMHISLQCIHRSVPCRDGCGTILPFSFMKDHLSRDCINRIVCSYGCGMLIATSLFDEHIPLCSHRPTTCQKCQAKVSQNKLTEHQTKHCPERVVACPQGCSEGNIKAKRLPNHMLSVCKNRWIVCSDGCRAQLMFCQLSKHLNDFCLSRIACSYGCGVFVAPSLNAQHENVCTSRRVTCPHCIESVQFNQLESHKRNDCSERVVPCSLGCHQRMIRAKELSVHITTQCPHREVACVEYCGEMVRFVDMETHCVQNCSGRVSCPLSCGSLLPPSKIEKHKAEACSRRKVLCSICHQHYPYESLAHHQKICPQRKISCPNNCGQQITASSEEEHKRLHCRYRLVACPEGCGQRIKFSEQDYHVNNSCNNAKTLCVTCGQYVKNSRMTIHDREECNRQCPNHHRLSLTMRANGFKCDKCRSSCSKGYSMCCLQDDYDLCTMCFPNSSVSCPYNCRTSNLFYRTINEHIKTCPNFPMTCFYCQQQWPRASLRIHQLNCSRRPSKIRVAQQTMTKFLNNMMSARDRCSVVGFNEGYKLLSTLDSEARAVQALEQCVRNCGGGTHLWDAIGSAVLQFVATANRSVPWVLVVLTDGDDQGSRCSISECAAILSAFNQATTNFTFVIGLGRDVNDGKLKQLCQATRSLYLPAEDSELLDVLFAMIAIQIVEGIRVDVASIGVDAAYARVRRATQLGRTPVEFLLLVDMSTSMQDK